MSDIPDASGLDSPLDLFSSPSRTRELVEQLEGYFFSGSSP